MAQRWYIVHTLAGYEEKVKAALEERIRKFEEDKVRRGERDARGKYFSEIIVPTETVMEVVRGKKRTTTKKIFPGYILVKMELNDETWHVVRSTPRVTGFAGNRSRPTPLPDDEAEELIAQLKEGAYQPKPRVVLREGDTVRVIEGPFANFVGTVQEVNAEKRKVKVLISIFGRATPIELDYMQVEPA
ncbi:MAG: transcription termination/antitermination protein NusG [Deltaproteobacteria bacterium]|nr:MAG: transcription termination/antitermination protein NusG [Deltaproteobacteria bacterium]